MKRNSHVRTPPAPSGPLDEATGAALALLENRWTLRLLTALNAGPARFGELEAAVPRLSRRLLSERLRHLEASGLLLRTVQPGPPITSRYSLTAEGQKLGPGLELMRRWAASRDPRAG
jgi:DNA-binding HxlR family transcriptional regulator